tara:strand:+ start:18570 stop:19886 length:1317 start_codon:yes stop_codon:yes gene_type:complete
LQKRTIAGNFDYNYDLNGQVTSSTSSAGNETFSYDEIGNRISDNLGSYGYNSTKQILLSTVSSSYISDRNGNIVGKTAISDGANEKYIYNSLNQLKEIQIYAGNSQLEKTIKYYYDPKGRRIYKSVVNNIDSSKSFSRAYIYDGDNVISEFDNSGNRLTTHIHSSLRDDDILSTEVTTNGKDSGIAKNAGRYHYIKDHLGSIEAVTDSSGEIIQKISYSTFGKVEKIVDRNSIDITNSPNVSTAYSFNGRELDRESGLIYYRARYYSPELGRFIQKDPDPGVISKPATFANKYAYVENNPLKFRDPKGKAKVPGDWTNVHGAYCGYSANGAVDKPRGEIIVDPEDSLDWACMDHDRAYAEEINWTSSRLDYSLGRVAGDMNLFLNGIAYMTIKPLDGFVVATAGALWLTYSLDRALLIDIPLNYITSLLNLVGIKIKL